MSRILVVDDDKLMTSLMQIVLEHEGYEVRVVNHWFGDLLTPSSALWNGVDVLLCDLNLDGKVDGVDVLAIAAHDHPTIRKVALSGAAPEHVNRAAAVADVVMRKPTNPFDILLALK